MHFPCTPYGFSIVVQIPIGTPQWRCPRCAMVNTMMQAPVNLAPTTVSTYILTYVYPLLCQYTLLRFSLASAFKVSEVCPDI